MDHYLEAIRQQVRVERTTEALLKLPMPVLLVLMLLAGTMLLALCATVLSLCWLLLQAVA
jgi:hypothetical protein